MGGGLIGVDVRDHREGTALTRLVLSAGGVFGTSAAATTGTGPAGSLLIGDLDLMVGDTPMERPRNRKKVKITRIGRPFVAVWNGCDGSG